MTAVLPRPAAAAARHGALTGLGLATRLAARRSRWFWLVWVLALTAVLASTLSAYSRLVPDEASGAATMQALAANPTMRALLGPPYALLDAGGFVMWRVGTFVAAAAGMMAALGVIRATRAEEEDGRIELLRSGAVGRHAPLGAGVLVALGACLLLALLATATLARGAPPAMSALAVGLGIGLTGAVFVGVGAVAAQLAASARSARAVALSVLGAAYLLRALADGSGDTSPLRPLHWLSPVEWAALARPYAGERWAVLLLPVLVTLLLLLLALALEDRRDHGAGLRAARPGPAAASPALSSAGALAWRLHRGSVIGWSVGIAVGSMAIGTLSGAMGSLVSDNPQLEEMFRRMGAGASQLREAFYVAMLAILVVVLAMLALQLVGRLRREEEQGHAEVLLATATSRAQLAASHVVPALLVPTVLLALSGAFLALPQALSEASGEVVGQLTGAALVLAPGIWLTVGLGLAVHGWAPRLGALPWAVLAWSLFVVWVGSLLNLPQALLDATPFAVLPQLPVEPFTWGPVLAVTAVAALLLAVGLLGFRRRDLDTA